MNTDFPKQAMSFLKADNFQDQELTLTYKGWEKKANVDREARGKAPATTWKQTLKYCLSYSFPEFAVDEIGEKIMGRDGKRASLIVEAFRCLKPSAVYSRSRVIA